ncbi:MAG: hypothetical protein M3Y65_18350 [Pseudomonadota bacterium]|nr:hypothetical protein [Pseudomonadota bacterium]
MKLPLQHWLFLFSGAAFVPALAAPPAAPETTTVAVRNGQLDYAGELDAAANQRLFDLYDTMSVKPTVLSIRSRGGEVNTGMALGTWVHARQLTVKVMEFCLSSCANCVFSAAPQKIVSKVAVVGFHGGPGNVDKLKFDAKTRAMLDAATPEARKAMLDDIVKTVTRDGKNEAAYFRKIGVRADYSSLGQDDRYQGFTKGADGWTYTREGFATLGVRDITVIDPP